MRDDIVEHIVSCMQLYNGDSQTQKTQTEHRLKLAEYWQIREGERILEIGCGQGDTTAVLAYLVGEQGMVYGVDNASPDYGSPITLAEAAAHLQSSSLGKQITMRFATDVLSSAVDFPEQYFDKIVLSHCSWYLQSFEQLVQIMEKAKRWGRSLCFAEWDAQVKTIDQLPHFLAILIQSQYESFKESSSANIRTLLTPDDAKRAAELAGWRVSKEESLNSSGLQDGTWEIALTMADYQAELDRLPALPTKFKSLIHSEVQLLQALTAGQPISPSLSTYAFVAHAD